MRSRFAFRQVVRPQEKPGEESQRGAKVAGKTVAAGVRVLAAIRLRPAARGATDETLLRYLPGWLCTEQSESLRAGLRGAFACELAPWPLFAAPIAIGVEQRLAAHCTPHTVAHTPAPLQANSSSATAANRKSRITRASWLIYSALPIVSRQGGPRKYSIHHGKTGIPNYSCRKATTGSTRVARRAGM